MSQKPEASIDLANPSEYHRLTSAQVTVLNAQRFALNYQTYPALTPEQKKLRDNLNDWWNLYREWQARNR